MKLHKPLFIVFLSLFSLMAHAQKSHWGFKGGLNFNLSQIGLDDAYNGVSNIFEGEQSHNGWHAGVVSRNYLSESFYLQLDALYSQSSNSITDDNGQEQEFNKNIGQFNISGGLRLFSILRVAGGLTGELALNEEYKDTFGPFAVGYNVGTGLSLGKLNLDILYNASFQDHTGEWRGIPLSHNTSQIMMSVGLVF